MTQFVETVIPGVLLVDPLVHRDDRGFFLETYHESRYRDGGICERFVQDNHSSSVKNTLRGLHEQSPDPQGKLVRVTVGDCTDYRTMARVFQEAEPEVVIHYAEQPSAPYSMVGYDEAKRTLDFFRAHVM